MIPPRIKNVIANDNYELLIEYQNGENKKYDMKKQFVHEYYNKLKNIIYFKQVKNSEVTVEWPDGEDVDPNELYENSDDLIF